MTIRKVYATGNVESVPIVINRFASGLPFWSMILILSSCASHQESIMERWMKCAVAGIGPESPIENPSNSGEAKGGQGGTWMNMNCDNGR